MADDGARLSRTRPARLAALLVPTLLAMTVPSAQAQPQGETQAVAAAVVGWISVQPEGAGLKLVCHLVALTAGEVSATLTLQRSGRSGTARVAQSSTMTLAAGQTAEVASNAISYGAGDRLTAELQVRRGGTLIARSSIEAGLDESPPPAR